MLQPELQSVLRTVLQSVWHSMWIIVLQIVLHCALRSVLHHKARGMPGRRRSCRSGKRLDANAQNMIEPPQPTRTPDTTASRRHSILMFTLLGNVGWDA
jgi:hypothetical protein